MRLEAGIFEPARDEQREVPILHDKPVAAVDPASGARVEQRRCSELRRLWSMGRHIARSDLGP
jgi:hypothetical protein